MATKKAGLGITTGDVYAARLANRHFGAMHVLAVFKDSARHGKESAIVLCTSYIGEEPPRIDHPALARPLRQNRFFCAGAPSIMVAVEAPPADFVHVGNLAPTPEELAIEPEWNYAVTWRAILDDVFREWRWEHDREALERQVEEQEAKAAAARNQRTPPGPRKRTPSSKLPEDEFWALISRLHVGDDGDAKMEPLVAALAKRSAADIREFQEVLAHKLYLLDGRQYAEQAGAAGDSSDAFLYARCFVVARGRRFFEDVLAHPERFPKDVDLEPLLNVAGEAYVAKTGDELDVTHYYCSPGRRSSLPKR